MTGRINDLKDLLQVFDAVENDLLSQEYLGASGVRSIYASDERVPGMPVESSRVLKALWPLQRITWVPRVPETLAKLLVRDLTTEIAPLRTQVEATLTALQEPGYVARDGAIHPRAGGCDAGDRGSASARGARSSLARKV